MKRWTAYKRHRTNEKSVKISLDLLQITYLKLMEDFGFFWHAITTIRASLKICPYFARRILLYFHLMNVIWEVLIIRKFVSKINFFGRDGLKKALIERKVILDEKGASPTLSVFQRKYSLTKKTKGNGGKIFRSTRNVCKENKLIFSNSFTELSQRMRAVPISHQTR